MPHDPRDCPTCGWGFFATWPNLTIEYCLRCGEPTVRVDGVRIVVRNVARKSTLEVDTVARRLGIPVADRGATNRNAFTCSECGHNYFLRSHADGVDYCCRCGLAHVLTEDKSARVPLVPNRRMDPRDLERRARESLEALGNVATDQLADKVLRGGK